MNRGWQGEDSRTGSSGDENLARMSKDIVIQFSEKIGGGLTENIFPKNPVEQNRRLKAFTQMDELLQNSQVSASLDKAS